MIKEIFAENKNYIIELKFIKSVRIISNRFVIFKKNLLFKFRLIFNNLKISIKDNFCSY